MAQWVTVWRAAHLVGVPRGVLQQRCATASSTWPTAWCPPNRCCACTRRPGSKTAACSNAWCRSATTPSAKRLRERLLPSQEVLAQRLFRQSQELADVQRHLQRYHALVLALRGELQPAGAGRSRPDPRLLALQHQLNDGLARALATESVDVLDVMDDMLKVVSAQVTLRPSGHQFAVEGHDTLLQAGLRAGLKLNYGCGNGSCGMCKVRVTDGQVVRTMHTDYPLSETGKHAGLRAGLRPHRRQQRADARDAGSRRPGRHPGAADRHHRAGPAAAGARHPAAAPADAAQPPPALPGRASRSRWACRAGDGNDVHATARHRQLPLRRPQPAVLHAARRRRPRGRAACSPAA
jgi:ferredoxin